MDFFSKPGYGGFVDKMENEKRKRELDIMATIRKIFASRRNMNWLHMGTSILAGIFFIFMGIRRGELALCGIGMVLFYLSDIYCFLAYSDARAEANDDEEENYYGH